MAFSMDIMQPLTNEGDHMNPFTDLTSEEAALINGGGDVTTTSNVATDLGYLFGVVVGFFFGAAASYSAGANEAYSVTDWKTGRTKVQ